VVCIFKGKNDVIDDIMNNVVVPTSFNSIFHCFFPFHICIDKGISIVYFFFYILETEFRPQQSPKPKILYNLYSLFILYL